MIGDEVVKNQNNVCDAFNKHFSKAGLKVQESIDKSSSLDPLSLLPKLNSRLKFDRITEGQICKVVESLQPKTSTGYDDISNVLLKKLIHVIKGPMCVIFNTSIETGTFPELMKVAKVVPLFKSGDSFILDNYRPIFLLPVISKVLEKLIYQKTVKYLEENKILYSRQFGFRKQHSTSDAVSQFCWGNLELFWGWLLSNLSLHRPQESI